MEGLGNSFSLYLGRCIADLVVMRSSHRIQLFRNFLRQVYFTFIQSISIIGILAITSGLALSLQAQIGLSIFGNSDRIGQFIVFILFRELAPVVTGLLLIARSVTAVASEVATMRVQQEIDALEFIGINPNNFIFYPRILAGTVSLFSMAVVFWIFSLVGAWIGTNWIDNLSIAQFLDSISDALVPSDIIFFVLKSSISGSLVFYIACVRGNEVSNSPFEVPIATNQAVVDALFWFLAFHACAGFVFYSWTGFGGLL